MLVSGKSLSRHSRALCKLPAEFGKFLKNLCANRGEVAHPLVWFTIALLCASKTFSALSQTLRLRRSPHRELFLVRFRLSGQFRTPRNPLWNPLCELRLWNLTKVRPNDRWTVDIVYRKKKAVRSIKSRRTSLVRLQKFTYYGRSGGKLSFAIRFGVRFAIRFAVRFSIRFTIWFAIRFATRFAILFATRFSVQFTIPFANLSAAAANHR